MSRRSHHTLRASLQSVCATPVGISAVAVVLLLATTRGAQIIAQQIEDRAADHGTAQQWQDPDTQEKAQVSLNEKRHSLDRMVYETEREGVTSSAVMAFLEEMRDTYAQMESTAASEDYRAFWRLLANFDNRTGEFYRTLDTYTGQQQSPAEEIAEDTHELSQARTAMRRLQAGGDMSAAQVATCTALIDEQQQLIDEAKSLLGSDKEEDIRTITENLERMADLGDPFDAACGFLLTDEDQIPDGHAAAPSPVTPVRRAEPVRQVAQKDKHDEDGDESDYEDLDIGDIADTIAEADFGEDVEEDEEVVEDFLHFLSEVSVRDRRSIVQCIRRLDDSPSATGKRVQKAPVRTNAPTTNSRPSSRRK